jgi:hypothetical protein
MLLKSVGLIFRYLYKDKVNALMAVDNDYDSVMTILDSKIAYKSLERYIAGSSMGSTKPVFLLLTKLLMAIKESLQRYRFIEYSKSSVSQR